MKNSFEYRRHTRNAFIIWKPLLLIISLVLVSATGFGVTQSLSSRQSFNLDVSRTRSRVQIIRTRNSVLFSSNEELYTETEIDDMRNTILSISKVKDDETRRSTVVTLMKEKTERDDPKDGAKFVQLWDKTLIVVGGEIQNAAREKAARMAPGTSSSSEDEGGAVATTAKQGDDELQLWALVDMMIQSKTIIKKAMES
eukprot:scaffold435_cov275-Chaetoceros_neogracile.AAC.54